MIQSHTEQSVSGLRSPTTARAASDFVTLGHEYDNAQRELDGMTIWQIHNTDRGHFLMDRVAELRSQWNGV